MKDNPICKEIKKAYSHKKFVRIYRGNLDEDGDYLVGIICSIGKDIACIADVHDGKYFFDGFSLFYIKDITRILTKFNYVGVMTAALDVPSFSEIVNLPINGGMREVIAYIAGEFPLFSVHIERYRNDVSYIGKISKLGQTDLFMKNISTEGRWNGISRFKIDEITKVSFGGLYEMALHKALLKSGARSIR